MKTRQNGFTLIELLFLLAIISIIAVSVFGLVGGCALNTNPGEGTKIGQVVRLNKEGVRNKTWEAELIRGGMIDGSGTVGTQPFHFTIENDEMAQKVKGYMIKQTEVIITYRVEGIYSPLRSGSRGTFLTSIEPTKK